MEASMSTAPDLSDPLRREAGQRQALGNKQELVSLIKNPCRALAVPQIATMRR